LVSFVFFASFVVFVRATVSLVLPSGRATHEAIGGQEVRQREG
jgi:hypothetical protein